MAIDNKNSPQGKPENFQNLNSQIQSAIRDQSKLDTLNIKLSINGGVNGERYHFNFDATGAGEAKCSMRNELADMDYKLHSFKMPQDDFINLFRNINISEMQEFYKLQNRIPPDSLIGRLEISTGKDNISIIYMADKEQAKTAGYEIPVQLNNVIESIFQIAARQLKAKDVRP